MIADAVHPVFENPTYTNASVATCFQETEHGVIPEDWCFKFLPEVCRFQGGKAHEQYISEYGNYICVNSKFISSDGAVVKRCKKNFSPAKANDILMVMSDLPNGKALAKAFIADRDKLYAVNQRVCSLTSYHDNPQYLFYFLNRNPYFLKFDDGVNQTHLLNRVFERCPVALPPTLKEQEAIAEALSDADALIEGLERLIAKKRLIKQGAMQELLSGTRRLPGFSGKWQRRSIGQLLTIMHGKNQRGVEHPAGSYPILATGGQIGWASSFLCDKPSVLIGRKGTIDKPQYMEKPFWTVDTLFYSDVREPNCAKFLYYRFYQIDWRKYNEASGVPTLNAGTIESIEIDTPEPKEQQTIASAISDMDAELDALDIKLEKARQIKQGMMQELLTGRIRLV